MIRSGPSRVAARSSRSNARSSRSATRCGRRRRPARASARGGPGPGPDPTAPEPRTRSRCTAATGSRSAGGKLSPSPANRSSGKCELIGRRAGPALRRFEPPALRAADREPTPARRSAPNPPRVGELPEHLFVQRQDASSRRSSSQLRRLALSQQQEGYRPQQHRPRADAQGGRFTKLIDRLGRGESELHARLELGHHEVIVAVEPLDDVQGCSFGAARPCRNTWSDRPPARRREPFRHRPEHHRRIEHVIVEREIVARGRARCPRIAATASVVAAVRPRRRRALPGRGFPPVFLDRPLQFPANAMRGKPRLAAMAIGRAPAS